MTKHDADLLVRAATADAADRAARNEASGKFRKEVHPDGTASLWVGNQEVAVCTAEMFADMFISHYEWLLGWKAKAEKALEANAATADLAARREAAVQAVVSAARKSATHWDLHQRSEYPDRMCTSCPYFAAGVQDALAELDRVTKGETS